MNAEFEIRITRNSLFRFLMYHSYHGASGILSIVAGTGLLLFFLFGPDGPNHWIYGAAGVLFLVYQPWSLYMRAAKQAQLNPVFKKPLRYSVTEDGIRVQQEEVFNEAAWEQVIRVRETAQSIFVYTGPQNAFIWVKEQIGDEEAAVRTLLEKNVAPKRCRLKKQ